MINIFIECYKILQQNNSNQKEKNLSLAYVNHKDAFLPKGASNEELWGVRIVKHNTILKICFFFGFLGGGLLCQDSVCMYKYPTAAI